jgi:cell division protease FtsH
MAPGLETGRIIAAGDAWQIVATSNGGRALLVRPPLAENWLASDIINGGDLLTLEFGDSTFRVICSEGRHTLSPLSKCHSPNDKVEALAFALALRATRSADPNASLDDGIYVEKLSRILPVRAEGEMDDAHVLGTWLTGGLRVSAVPMARIQGLLSWLSPEHLKDVVEAAGFSVDELVRMGGEATATDQVGHGDWRSSAPVQKGGRFSLPGRAYLEEFFNDHVVDVVQNREHYRALGIGNPSAVILEGPAGCGKTVAAERLIEFLGWPNFSVEASSIASPYIHETSRKISQLFNDAIDAAPSVIVIDEMDAFLAERDGGASSQYRVEEVAEFLRRIPEAIKAGVLIIGMTNRVDMIDPAVLRRGRFDHVIKVDYADDEEMLALLRSLLEGLPVASDVELNGFASRLAGRPLSDAAFVVREGARLAAKQRKSEIDAASLAAALAAVPPRASGATRNPIGFV